MGNLKGRNLPEVLAVSTMKLFPESLPSPRWQISPRSASILHPSAFIRYPSSFILLFLLSLPLTASNLVDNSPFIPEGFNASSGEKKTQSKQQSVATRDLEFRGVYSLGGEYHFNIYNKKDQMGEWVRLNDPGAEYRVLRFDEATTSVQLNLDGETEEIFLKERDNKPLPVQLATTGNPGNRNARNVAGGRNTGNRASNRRSGRQPVVRRRVMVPNREGGSNSNAASRQTRSQKTRVTPENADQLIKDLTNKAREKAAQRK